MNWEKYGIDVTKVRSGKSICPKCSHTRKDKKDPCLSVDLAKGLFNCHHCNFKGNASFEYEKKEYIKPLPRLQKVSEKACSWFESRGISNNTLLRFGITSSLEWMPQVQKQMNVICFNYFKDNELVNIKFRDGAKNFKLSKDSELVFYNIDSIKDSKIACVVEGEIDSLTMHECGFYNCVSVPNGASRGSQRLEYLDNCWSYFEDKEKIYLAVDNDEAGRSLKEELARRLGKERCFFVCYPDGCKDANEVLLKYGKDAVLDLISNAVPYPLEGILTVDDLEDEVTDMYENGYPEGYSAGIKNFDNHLTFVPSQLTMVTGIPGCFYKNQLIETSIGSKRISDIKTGDLVLSYNHELDKNEYRVVTKTHKFKERQDKLYKIKLKDGTEIRVTENHEFFTGIEYVKISDLLLSLQKNSICGK